MKRFAKLLTAVAGLVVSGSAFAAGGHALPYSYTPDTSNLASLQRGARDFMAYCSGCHSMKYLRYNRIGQDLGIHHVLIVAVELTHHDLDHRVQDLGDLVEGNLAIAIGV